MLATRENFPLLAELLTEQQRLDTPATRFATAYDSPHPSPADLAPQLIPLSAPKPGEQYAFEVDLDSCTGCKSCVAACHSLNGLDDTETWRDVGVLVSPSRARPFTQTVTTACHHCADPACLNGCPVLAYEKDPVTGIVRHLDDQCIGCSYCILKCPYDVPKFSERLGIVRKCDMCHNRLAAGEAPACAQACPTHAIRIVTVTAGNWSFKTGDRSFKTGNRKPETGEWSQTGDRKPETENRAVLHSEIQPRSESTIVTSASAAPSLASGFPFPLSFPSPVSPPFPVSGIRFPVSSLPAPASGLQFLPGTPDPGYTQPTTRYISRRPLPAPLVAGDAATLRPQPPHWPLVFMLTLLPSAVGLACAAALLRPHQSESASDWVTLSSWLAGLSGLSASVFHLGQPTRAWRIFLGWRRSWLSREAMVFGAWVPLASAAIFAPGFLIPSAITGLIGLACSAMIYIDTRRHFWRAAQTVPRFFGTAALLAVAPFAPLLAAAMLGVKVAWESRTFFDQSVSARLQRGPLRKGVLVRDSLAALGIVLLVISPGWLALTIVFAGEIAERHLFFRAVDAPKMPGVAA